MPGGVKPENHSYPSPRQQSRSEGDQGRCDPPTLRTREGEHRMVVARHGHLGKDPAVVIDCGCML